MTPLHDQELLESLLASRNNKNEQTKKFDPIVIIYFSASWCGPCNRIELHKLLSLSDKIKWYLCDVDDNDYSPGYCGVKSIPSFLAILNGQAQPLYSNSNTESIISWMKNGFKS